MLLGSHDVLLITDPRFKTTHLCPVNILFRGVTLAFRSYNPFAWLKWAGLFRVLVKCKR
jgi:hypothetical protein